jgi:cell division protein WhiA
VRGVERVVIRDADAIAAMLTCLGAHQTVLAWEERRKRRAAIAARTAGTWGSRSAGNLDEANLSRSMRAAEEAADRAGRALRILGDDVPDHLSIAGKLRIAHRRASLEALGKLADPPLTKDAIAGRIRRLLAIADRRAAEHGIAGTEAPGAGRREVASD